MTDNLVVILTALNLEYDAVRARLSEPRLHRHSKGTRFEIGTISETDCRIALGQTGKGNHAAGILAERAMEEFGPIAVIFVGVAGALRSSIPFGDVVMATHMYAYHGGTSQDDGFKARPRTWETAHWISQVAMHLSRTDAWAGPVPGGRTPPRVHFGAIAAGEVLQNSRTSYEAKLIQDHYNDALAIEMEGAGVAQAGHLAETPVAVIRGISDLADGTKSSDTDRDRQPRAAANAAAFAVRLAEELIIEREHAAIQEGNTMNDAGAVNNFSSGQVGIQAGHVTGSTVWMGTAPRAATPAGLVAELAAFRNLLIRERSVGRIDETTYEAAKAELDIADEALAANTPEGRNLFILALKRLRGLIADVTDLATRIMTLLAAAKELQ